MKKEKLMGYLGKKVTVKLFTGQCFTGELHSTAEDLFKDDPSIHFRPGFFLLCHPRSWLFRSSHVTSIREV